MCYLKVHGHSSALKDIEGRASIPFGLLNLATSMDVPGTWVVTKGFTACITYDFG
jgi:hypothetical protein